MTDQDSEQILTCEHCAWEMKVPPGTPIALLRNDCPECGNEVTMYSNPNEKEVSEDFDRDTIGFDFLPPPFEKEDFESLEFVDPPEQGKGTSKPWTGFANRITPVILASQISADMERSGIPVDERLIDRFSEIGKKYRKSLLAAEDEHGISRGMRLSDGFPQDSEKSVRRFSRTYLGADSKKRAFEEGGLAQTLGLISVQLQEEDGLETIVVRNTDTGKAALTIPLHRNLRVVKETHKSGLAGDITIPKWVSDAGVDRILMIIEGRSNGEYLWIKFLLAQINSQIQGLDIEGMVDREIRRELADGSLRRWFERNKDVPIVEDLRKSGASEDEISEALEDKIKSTITGTLGRMKEMALIFQFKKARKTYYKTTKRGREWAMKMDQMDYD